MRHCVSLTTALLAVVRVAKRWQMGCRHD
jgi:hypothetical protein